MLAYTAADSLNAIARTHGVGSQPTIVTRSHLASPSVKSPSTLRSLYRRALGHTRSPRRP